MKDFTFAVGQEIIFVDGSLSRLGELLKKSNSRKPFIISGKRLTKLGVLIH